MFPRGFRPWGLLILCGFAHADPNATPITTNATPAPDAVTAQRRLRVATGLRVEPWATEPLVQNITSIAFDQLGRAYVVETGRRRTSVFDLRNFKEWVEDDLALRSVPDRANFLRGQLATNELFQAAATKSQRGGFGDFNQDGHIDAHDLEVESERIRLVWDSEGKGRADRALTFADGFSTIVSGVAAGVLVEGTNVWFACIPDLWRLPAAAASDPAPAGTRERLHTGFGVHIAFGGHDLHGLITGPDARLYFSIADRGSHVTNREGSVIALPDTGAVFRCEPDGANLQVVARGLRNPQELAFDAEGNLWTGDNNGDGGDKARWTLVLPDADYGWTMGWQWLPKMGAWNSERLWDLADTNTAAYLVPPVAHVGHGPAGIAFYPGTGLGDRYRNTFFFCDFPGGVRTFRVERRGGWFGVVDAGPWLEDNSITQSQGKLLWNLSPVDVTFPPGGGVIVADWVEGWEKTGKGRLWRVFDPALQQDPAIADVRRLLAEGMASRTSVGLAELFGHEDLRIRQSAQFEAARRGIASWPQLTRLVAKSADIRVRRHAIRALRQLVRTETGRTRFKADLGEELDWLQLRDSGLVREACRLFGDAHLGAAQKRLQDLFSHADPQVGADAMLAYRELIPYSPQAERWSSMVPLQKALETGGARNPLLRHAASQLLASLIRNPVLGNVPSAAPTGDPLRVHALSLVQHEDPAVRLVALLADREAGLPAVSSFLDDTDPQLVLEAARAIHDRPIPVALPALAQLLLTALPVRIGARPPKGRHPFTAEEGRTFVLRRAVNAAFRLGSTADAALIVSAAAGEGIPESVRVQALESLRDWARPPRRDRLTGLIVPLPPRSSDAARDALDVAWSRIADPAASSALLVAAIESGRALGLPGMAERVSPFLTHRSPEVQAAARNQPIDTNSGADRNTVGSNPPGVEQLLNGGDVTRGRKLFAERAEWGCQRCHKLRGEGGDIGPDLTGLGTKVSRAQVLDSILQPNRVIAPGFETLIVTRRDETSVVGVLKSETATDLVIDSPEEGRVTVRKADVKSRDRAASSMPEGLGDLMTRGELRDLVEALSVP